MYLEILHNVLNGTSTVMWRRGKLANHPHLKRNNWHIPVSGSVFKLLWHRQLKWQISFIMFYVCFTWHLIKLLLLLAVLPSLTKPKPTTILLGQYRLRAGLLPRRNLKTQQSPFILDLCLRKTRSGKSHGYRDTIVYKKLRFQDVFLLHENVKPAFSNSSG